MQNIIVVILLAISINGNTQTLKTVKDLKSSYQICLDQGNYMAGCSIDYYNQVDSLLNVVYQNLKHQLNSEDRPKFLQEQKEWLKKRDAYFRKITKTTIKEGVFSEGTADFEMVVTDKKADFVVERLKVLIERL
jgi:uncharacterized protein YecT (DUF1311 family)